MKTSKKKWLYRALCAAMAVALVSGTAVMTPIADFVGTSITANAVTGVSSESALRNALASGGTIQLTDDIVFSSSFEVKGASVLDLNGHTLSVSSDYTSAFSLSANLAIKDSSTAGTGTIRLGRTNVPQMFWFDKDVQLNIQSGNLIVGGVAGVLGNLARSDTDRWGTVTISGGNIDVTILSRVIDRGLQKTGRLAEFTIALTDKPGELTTVSKVISKLGANVVAVSHDRADLNTDINSCYLRISLETRNHEHIARIKDELSKKGYRIVQ